MWRFKLPSKFHAQPNVCGRTFGVSMHLFRQETPLGSFMHPMAEPRQPIELPRLHIHSSRKTCSAGAKRTLGGTKRKEDGVPRISPIELRHRASKGSA
ncbi:hypothetical protein PVK06_027677 [Gossypium arboreum]|uniref:Uncharacterized protein n=1 Tax=Gossypium arboreum TaxID=29729 RepID=A0ABR0P0X8_GOSAR|nr:hypothetical protein PVK06_027677 [Gossypium arboreum]